MTPRRAGRRGPGEEPAAPQYAGQFGRAKGRKVAAGNAGCRVVYKCISCRNQRVIRTCRNVDPFTKNCQPIRPVYKIEILLKIPQPPEFSQEPVTLGEHLRRCRLERGLYQKDVAAQLGVTTSSVWNWEHGWTVDQRYISRIIVFLGYNPGPTSSPQ